MQSVRRRGKTAKMRRREEAPGEGKIYIRKSSTLSTQISFFLFFLPSPSLCGTEVLQDSCEKGSYFGFERLSASRRVIYHLRDLMRNLGVYEAFVHLCVFRPWRFGGNGRICWRRRFGMRKEGWRGYDIFNIIKGRGKINNVVH